MPEARPHLHSDTEIYAAVIALAKFCVLASRQMPRDVKQLLGAQLRDETLWMTVLIQRANIARDAAKLPHLDRTRVANVVRWRGFSVDHQLTKTYRRSA